jgi:hypothetical protein
MMGSKGARLQDRAFIMGHQIQIRIKFHHLVAQARLTSVPRAMQKLLVMFAVIAMKIASGQIQFLALWRM